jgi:branched-subunit amino acid ABC-type transport system permease component
MLAMNWGALLWALIAAFAIAVVGASIKAILMRPERSRVSKIMDAATHRLIVQGHGYTLRLMSESGEEIGVQEHGRFAPSWYRHSPSFVYHSAAYEVVSVQDDYPAATGTLVLRPVPE